MKEKKVVRYKFAKVGDKVDGQYVGCKTVDLQNGPATQYTLKTEEGVVVLLGTAQLNDLFDGVAIGRSVSIEYTGTAKSNAGRDVKTFRFFTDEE